MPHDPDPASIRCPVCGVPWNEHDTTAICERYRPRPRPVIPESYESRVMITWEPINKQEPKP